MGSERRERKNCPYSKSFNLTLISKWKILTILVLVSVRAPLRMDQLPSQVRDWLLLSSGSCSAVARLEYQAPDGRHSVLRNRLLFSGSIAMLT